MDNTAFFIRYLKEKNLYLRYTSNILHELTKKSYNELFFDNNNKFNADAISPYFIICESFNWSKTTEGDEFWGNENSSFRSLIMHLFEKRFEKAILSLMRKK